MASGGWRDLGSAPRAQGKIGACHTQPNRGREVVTRELTERGGGSATASKPRVSAAAWRPTVNQRHCGVEGEAAGRFVSEGVARARERVKKGGAVVTSAF
jgi:hypothetical protein